MPPKIPEPVKLPGSYYGFTMESIMKKRFLLTIALLLSLPAVGKDWPIYKGNIYFTGNNDEITVKNSNLKWLYQASNRTLNPIVSSGKIYFLDLAKKVYCLDQETGKPIWIQDLRRISSRFRVASKSFGKSKYPLIKGDRLFISDNIALYCMNKNTGDIIWARTGMRQSDPNLRTPTYKRQNTGFRDPVRSSGNWRPRKSTYAIVDSIYSDPVIVGDTIYYGTRQELLSRNIKSGKLLWSNDNIKSWSKFPSFYDGYLFTQSMDYRSNTYTLLCMDSSSGRIIWKKNLQNPHRIFPPVVYRNRVYIGTGQSMHALKLKDGTTLWNRNYEALITSNPSFTERAILFTLGNNSLVMINPDTGDITRRVDFQGKTTPYFVTVCDQVYVASSFKKNLGGRELPWAKLEAFNMISGKKGWTYSPQFPGAASQPVAAGGILFLPAGNYLYAIGTDYYPRIVKGGSGYYDPYNRIEENEKPQAKTLEKLKKSTAAKVAKRKKMPMRDIKISVKNDKGKPIAATIEVKKWNRGKVVYSRKHRLNRSGTIKIPDMDDVEITASSADHLPEKVIAGKNEKEKTISLNEIQRGKGIVVNNIHFEVNKAYLRKESLNILDKIIVQLKRQPSIKLEVRGHTDSSGGKAYNQKLSERRADAVMEYLIKGGISPSRLKSTGYGETKPIASNKTRAGRKKNRRTEFFVLAK